jgi:hypothetical protein
VADRPRSTAHWIVLAAAAACPLALAALAILFEPAPEGHGTHTQLGLPPCTFLELTALPCPGCGVTTAAVLAAQGEFAGALAVQPFGASLALGLAAFPLWVLIRALGGADLGAPPGRRAVRGLMFLAGFLALGAWFYRLALVP